MIAKYFMIVLVLYCNIYYAQTISVSTGTVSGFYLYNAAKSQAIQIDSVRGQFRSLAIDTIGDKIGIRWQIGLDTVNVQYIIEKKSISRDIDSNSGKISYNLKLMAFDTEGYPILILQPLVTTNLIYLFYYWDNHLKAFTKSERVVVTNYKKIILE